MVLDISLDHLKEEEVEAILKVLERDAKIQQQEETRRRRLRESVKRERIPQKRLSVKLRTGDWMQEVTAPSRVKKRRGTEIVRASIRRKDKKTPNKIVENGQIEPSSKAIDGKESLEDEKSKIAQPLRKTSVRRKKLSKSGDKQVKFDTGKTKEFVYEPTPVDSPAKTEEPKLVPTIVIHEEAQTPDVGDELDAAQPVEATVIADDSPQPADDGNTYNTGVFSSNATFESYHNSVGKTLHHAKEQNAEKVDENVEKTDAPKGMKKVRVVKRKGSSRRKMGKITDDSSRDTLFHTMEDDKSQKQAEEKVETATTVTVSENAQKEIESQVSKEAEFAVEKALISADMEKKKDTKPMDDVDGVGVPNVASIESKNADDSGLISDVLPEVSKEYEKLVHEEKQNIMGYSDAPNPDMNDGFQHKIKDENFLDHNQQPTIVIEAKLATEEVLKVKEEPGYSPMPDLDLGLDDVLHKFSKDSVSESQTSGELKPHLVGDAKVEMQGSTVVVETHQPGAVSSVMTEIHPQDDVIDHTPKGKVGDVLPVKVETVVDDSVSVINSKTLDEFNAKDDFTGVVEKIESATEISGQEAESFVESVIEAAASSPAAVQADITIPEHPQDGDQTPDDSLAGEVDEKPEETEHKLKKKVVKRVVKKKKKEEKGTAEEGDHQGSPKSEATQENVGNTEESTKLQRTRTVRRKVIRKPPPPPAE